MRRFFRWTHPWTGWTLTSESLTISIGLSPGAPGRSRFRSRSRSQSIVIGVRCYLVTLGTPFTILPIALATVFVWKGCSASAGGRANGWVALARPTVSIQPCLLALVRTAEGRRLDPGENESTTRPLDVERESVRRQRYAMEDAARPAAVTPPLTELAERPSSGYRLVLHRQIESRTHPIDLTPWTVPAFISSSCHPSKIFCSYNGSESKNTSRVNPLRNLETVQLVKKSLVDSAFRAASVNKRGSALILTQFVMF